MKSGLGKYALLLALVCGLLAAWANWQVVKAQEEKAPVLKVVREIQPYTAISAEAVRVEMIPKDAVPEGALTTVEALKDQYSRTALIAGDIIRDKHLVKAEGSNLSARLAAESRPDLRAMAIQVNDSTSVAGTVREGDPVDILVAIESGSGNNAGTLAKIIAQRVPVLLVQKGSDGGLGSSGSGMTVVLQVTPQQAEELAFAQAQGMVWLITTPYQVEGDQVVETTGIDAKTFMAKYGNTPGSAAAQSATSAAAPKR